MSKFASSLSCPPRLDQENQQYRPYRQRTRCCRPRRDARIFSKDLQLGSYVYIRPEFALEKPGFPRALLREPTQSLLRRSPAPFVSLLRGQTHDLEPGIYK